MQTSLRAAGWGSSRLVNRFLSRRLTTAAITPDDCDVVIVGGGPAGLALASALASSRSAEGLLNVALVEAGDLSKIHGWHMPSDAYSNRVSSLTNVSEEFLRDIGIWDHIDHTRTWSMEDMQVWDGISDARIQFSASQLGIGSRFGNGPAYMARLVENLNLQRAALQHLDKHPSIKLLDKTKVETIVNDASSGGWPLVHLSTGQILRARLLIGADGFNSPVRKFAGIQSFGWSYPTHAVVATMRHAPCPMRPSATAYQRFLPTGPIAFLPLSPTEASLVWSTRPALAAALTKSDPAALAAMINAAFRLPDVSMKYLHQTILGKVESGASIQAEELTQEIAWREQSHQIGPHSPLASALIDPISSSSGIPPADAELYPPLVQTIQPGTIASFPLRLSHAESYIGEGKGGRTVLVGDAAHTIHPLAGQGLNGGLSDVECLARCIGDAITSGGDIGSHTALAPYARERYIQNHGMLSAVDKLHKIYSTDAAPLVWARSVGVEVLNELDTLKAGLMLGAGAKMSVKTGSGGFNTLASAIENVNDGVRIAKAIGLGLQGIGSGVLRQASDALARRV